MRRFPTWYWAAFGLVALLYVSFTVYYHTGAEGVEISGADLDFGRGHDFAMYKIDDQRAYLISGSGGLSVVKYEPGIFPFCYLCGTYQPAGSVVNGARYLKGDWAYTDYPGRFYEGFNLKTGAFFDVKSEVKGSVKDLDPAAVPEYQKRGLTFEDGQRASAQQVVDRFEPLSTLNESCLVFNMAFLVVFNIMVVIGVALVFRRRPA